MYLQLILIIFCLIFENTVKPIDYNILPVTYNGSFVGRDRHYH
jgi:hypothetical protein